MLSSQIQPHFLYNPLLAIQELCQFDPAEAFLLMSLSALQLGEQYVAITENACKHTRIETEIELSHPERIFLRDLSESQE